MTGAVLALRASAAGTGARADTVALGGLAVLVGSLAVATWGTWGDLDSDTGYDVVAGARVADGELPYRDFVYYYGPLAPFASGLASLLGGDGFWPIIGLGFVVALGIIAATYALARIVIGPLGAFLAASITAAVGFIPGNYSYVLPHTNDATLGTLLLLGVLVTLWRHASTGQSRWLTAAGGGLGCLALTKPEPAAAALVAVVLWLAVGGAARLRHDAALVAIPALLIAGTVYGAFLSVVSPRRLFLENLYPVEVLEAGGDTLVRARMPLTVASLLDLGGKVLLYAAGTALLVAAAYGIGRAGIVRRLVLAALAGGALLAVAASFVNPEALRHGLQFAYGWIPAGAALALAFLLWQRVRRHPGWDAKSRLELACAGALAVVGATSYGGFFPHAPHEQMAVYYMPLAAILLVRLHLGALARRRAAYVLGALWIGFLAAAGTGLTLKDAQAESATVRGPGGALAETPVEAALYETALAWIARETDPGEPIFVAPLMTGLYPLSTRPSALEEISIIPGALPAVEDERRAIAALDRAGVRLVLTDDREWPGYGHSAFGRSFDRVLAAWIASSFDRAATFRIAGDEPRTLVVWLRRER